MSEGQHLAETLVAFYAYDNHGVMTPFTSAVAGLSAGQAAADPGHGLQSVWAYVHHVRFWQEVALLQLRGLPVDRAALGGEDGWPAVPDPPEQASWEAAVARSAALNGETAELVEALSDTALAEVVVGAYVMRWQVVQSLIAHNTYHTCSIIAARRLLGLWPPGA
ncbi:MAG: DinB family protein [Anaerolineae bacterium]|nr:DinB family protein [Anaerolineae bacterium]